MKYRGKYSLTENFAGRGLGLLNENGPIETEGGWLSGPSGSKVYATQEEAQAAFDKGQMRGGIGAESQAGAAAYIESKYAFGTVNPGGRGGADDLVIDGVKIEVGKGLSKYSELGMWDSASNNWSAGKPQTVAKQELTAPIVQELGGASALGKGVGKNKKPAQLKPADVEAFWKATTDDAIMLDDEEGGYHIFALNEKGASLDFNGQNPPMLTAAACNDGWIQSGGQNKGRTRYGVQFTSINWDKALTI